jgi:hypothetical protein
MRNNSSLSILTLSLLSAFAGGCLIVLFVLVPFWQNSTAEIFLSWFTTNSKAVGLTMLPMEVFPLITCAILYFVARRQKMSNQILWLLTNICNLIILAIFIVYFLPTNTAMASGTFSADKVSAELQQWKTMHIIRTILSALAVVFCGLAIRKTGE